MKWTEVTESVWLLNFFYKNNKIFNEGFKIDLWYALKLELLSCCYRKLKNISALWCEKNEMFTEQLVFKRFPSPIIILYDSKKTVIGNIAMC